MIKFRQKDFSVLSSTIKGATIGTSIGTIASGFSSLIPNDIKNRFRIKRGADSETLTKLAVVGTGTIVGASLGLLAGAIKESDKFISRKLTVDNRLMETVKDYLIKTGFKEGHDFTRDPKTANNLKAKICIVITKNSGELRVLINTVADTKLKNLTDELVKNLPNTSVVNKTVTDKFNEITLSKISDASADAGLITGIAEKFIRSGYPVYLVEVG